MTAAQERSLVIERQLPHAPEKIWRALTQGPLISEWLMANDLEPVVGHKFNFRATPVAGWNGVIDSEILVAEPNTKLSYRWNSMGVETVVAWTLQAADGGTLLRFEQSGFAENQEANYKGAKYGWQKFIGNLERVVDALQS